MGAFSPGPMLALRGTGLGRVGADIVASRGTQVLGQALNQADRVLANRAHDKSPMLFASYDELLSTYQMQVRKKELETGFGEVRLGILSTLGQH